MPRYKLIVEYEGTPYAGWQRQNDQPSVQGELERAALKFCGEKLTIVGAGRTDAGVHATAQAAHIDLPREMDAYRVMQGLNYYLFNDIDKDGKTQPADCNRIAIVEAQAVPDTFHARFSATRRHYLYRIINRRSRLSLETNRAWLVSEHLDVSAMNDAAQLLVGHHDFSSFRDTMCQSKSPEKTLEKLQVTRHGEEIRVITYGRSFLHHQVRIMVGTLALVGKGRWTKADVQKSLDAKDRKAGGPTCPPEGLYLTGVEY
jgi:tRNA pseudouridine38-40 synthase